MSREREVPVRIIIRKKKGHAGHHGGAWKVAFADFMTAMFALFLVLWLINQSSDVKSAIAGYFQDPLGRANEFGSSIMPGDGAQASMVRTLQPSDIVDMRRDRLQQLAKKLSERLEKEPSLASVRDHIEIQLTEDGLRIQLLEDSVGVFFDTGRPIPNPKGKEILSLLGSELGKLPNPIRIEGYTDARPYSASTNYSNWELSADRANAARRIMTTSGLRSEQVAQIRGLADHDLRNPNDPLAASNRRITITMMFTPLPDDADSTATDAASTLAAAASADSAALGTGGAVPVATPPPAVTPVEPEHP